VRWEQLFADLEAQLDAEAAAGHRAEVADRTRREQAAVTVLDRLSAYRGHQVQVGVAGVGRIEGSLVDVAAEWLLIEEQPGHPSLVPARAWIWLTGIGSMAAVQPASSMARRLGLTAALRGLAQQRRPVRVRLTEAAETTGTIDRVYADHVDLAEHPADAARRPADVLNVRLLPMTSIALVRPA
jgi:hypothetical protein